MGATELLQKCLERCQDQGSPSTTAYADCVDNCCLDGGTCIAEDRGGLPLWASLLIAGALVVFSALFSGLTLGLMSLDNVGLQILAEGGDEEEKKYAKKIMPVRKTGNRLLCTLLLGNTLVNAAVSILLSDITTGVIGLVVSTGLILVFGEIIPQAICSRHGLKIGSATLWMVKFFMLIFFPIVWPVAKILDHLLGEDIGTVYSQEELKRLITIHVENPQAAQESGLTHADHVLLQGALSFKSKTVREVMTTIDKVFMLSLNRKLDFETMMEIYRSGFTRVPIYEGDPNNFVAVLFVKDLIMVDPDDEMELETILNFRGRNAEFVEQNTRLDVVFNTFRERMMHILLVYRTYTDQDGKEGKQTTGIITLEDVLEELIQGEIVDETDHYEDMNVGTLVHRKDRHRDIAAFLQLFDHKIKIMRELTKEEIHAICSYLSNNVREFYVFRPAEAILKRLIFTSDVEKVEVVDKQHSNHMDGSVNGGNAGTLGEAIYQRGVPSELFTLVLQGKVLIVAGGEEFELELGPWSVLGNKALTQTRYLPDFCAYPIGSCRLVRISKSQYEAALNFLSSRITEGARRSPRANSSQDDLLHTVQGHTTSTFDVENPHQPSKT